MTLQRIKLESLAQLAGLVFLCGCTPIEKTPQDIRAEAKPGLVTIEKLANLLEDYPLCDDSSSTCQEQKVDHETRIKKALELAKDTSLAGGLVGRVSDLRRQSDGKWELVLSLSQDLGESKADSARQRELLDKFSSLFQGKDPGEWEKDILTGACVTHLTPDLNAPAEVTIRINDAEISPGVFGDDLKEGGYALIKSGKISPPSAFMSTWVSGYYNKSRLADRSNPTFADLNLHAHTVLLEPVRPDMVELVNRCR